MRKVRSLIMKSLIPFLFLFGCEADGVQTSDDLVGDGNDSHMGFDDDSGTGDTDPVDVPSGTNGTIPPVALIAPDFQATNRDGGARDREDLLGHPTIIWFYPAAGTYG